MISQAYGASQNLCEASVGTYSKAVEACLVAR